MASNTGSLFGGGGLGASTTPQSNSLFGANNSTASPFANFSTTGAQGAQGAPTSSLFGGQSQAQQQPAQTSTLGQTQQAGNPQAQGQPASQSTQPAFFNSLLERGKKRPLSSVIQNNNFEDVPSLQLGLDDIRRKARELGSAGQKDTTSGKNSKA